MSYNMKKTVEYYDQTANTYDDSGYCEIGPYYPANLYRLEIAKEIVSKLPRGRILDAGCGTGKFLAYLTEKGYNCAGCDFSSNMLRQSQHNISKVSSRKVPLIHTSIDNLSMFEDKSFDHIFCLGVFPYIPEDQEEQCYHELYRVIKPRGYFITAHENEIFDTFTFNKYTLRFFERNIYPLLCEVSNNLNLEELKSQMGTLIKNPDKPINVDLKKSGRDVIFTKPDNPITYPEKLSKYRFKNKEILYYHFHAMPPLLRNNNPKLLEISKKMEIRFSRKWQGMFMSSTFISIAQRVEGGSKK